MNDILPAAERELLKSAWHRLRKDHTPDDTSALSAAFGIGRPKDLDELLQLLDRRLAALEREEAEIRALRDRADAMECAAGEVSATRYKRLRRQLLTSFDRDPAAGFTEWLTSCAELLADWQLSVLAPVVADLPLPFRPEDEPVVRSVRDGVDAVLKERFADALAMIESLVERGAGLDSDRARLLALAARIHLEVGEDSESALLQLERAAKLDPGSSVVLTVLGERMRRQGDADGAGWRFTQAIRAASDRPDAYVGLALLAEDEAAAGDDGAWDRASQLYDQAVRAAKGSDAVARRLLAPAPANLYWRLAKYLARAQKSEDALVMIDRAIALSVRGEGLYPERRAYRDKAKLLLKLERPVEAAHAYYEAGRRYLWDQDLARAAKVLRSSIEHDPSQPEPRWYLAEVLRAQSYATPVDRRTEVVGEAIEHWQVAYDQLEPDDEWAWVYASRALLAGQLANDATSWSSAAWEAVGYLERSLILDPNDAWAWIILAQQHRMLGNRATGKAAVSVASELAYDATLLNIVAEEWLAHGESAAAEAVVDRRLALDDSVEGRVLGARVRFCSHGPRQALGAAEAAIADHPENHDLRAIAAYAHYVLGERVEALEQIQWLWEQRNGGAEDLPAQYGWYAFVLGRYDEAAALLEQAFHETWDQTGGLLRDLGQAQLAQGRLVEGARSLDSGIAMATSVADIDAVRLDLEQLAADLGTTTAGAPALKIIEAAVDRLASRGVELATTSSPLEEIEHEIGVLNTSTAQRTAAQLTLARLRRDEGDSLGAAREYRSLAVESTIREARAALRAVALDALDRAPEPAVDLEVATLASWWRLLAAEVLPTLADDEHLAAALLGRAAMTTIVADDGGTGEKLLADALCSMSQLRDAIAVMGEVVGKMRVSATEAWAIDKHLTTALDLVGSTDATDRALMAQIAPRSLSRHVGLSAEAAAAHTVPIVDPIVLDLGSDLYPALEAQEMLFRDLLPGLYERIATDTGVDVPAIPVVEVESLEPLAYSIKLDETVIAGGVVPDDVVTALGFVLEHLEAVLRRLVSGFVGPLEVGRWLDGYVAAGGDQAVADRYREDRAVRLGFVRLLRNLLRESVPIHDRDRIVKVVVAADFEDVGSLTGQVRLALRDSLAPEPRVVLPIPPAVEDAMAALLPVNRDDQRAIPRAEIGKLVNALRKSAAVRSTSSDRLVLSTSHPELRAALARLASVAVPLAAVLSHEELAG